MISTNSRHILNEISLVFLKSNFISEEELIKSILSSNKVVCVGAGRVGFALRGFSMRLAHLGKQAFMLGDSNVPRIAKGDLLVVASGSGETQTIYDLVKIGKKEGAKIALITGNPDSRMGKLADIKLILRAPSKTKEIVGFTSIQPMTTLNEQCLSILLDSLVLDLMEKMEETHESMWGRHSNLE